MNFYVPKDKVDEFSRIDSYSRTAKLRRIYSNSGEEWFEHKIRSGETLGSIAIKYGTSVSKLKKWNGLIAVLLPFEIVSQSQHVEVS